VIERVPPSTGNSDPVDLNGHAPKDAIASGGTENLSTSNFVEGFKTLRDQAKQALQFVQVSQQQTYNENQLPYEFEVGDTVLINPHSLRLLRAEKGRGRKLPMKYDGPFEILQKLGPATYRLHMPASYDTHPVLNIAHLEAYALLDPQFGTRSTQQLNRDDFKTIPEYEVECVLQERWKKGRNGRHIQELLTRLVGC
jgi:hypothetical protein